MDANTVILCTPDQIKNWLRETMEECIQPLLQKVTTPNQVTYPEKLSKDQALAFLEENGYPTTEANLYRMTSKNLIPSARIGKRLIFNKTQLLDWLEARSISKADSKEKTVMSVSKSARGFQHMSHKGNRRRQP